MAWLKRPEDRLSKVRQVSDWGAMCVGNVRSVITWYMRKLARFNLPGQRAVGLFRMIRGALGGQRTEAGGGPAGDPHVVKYGPRGRRPPFLRGDNAKEACYQTWSGVASSVN